MKTMGEIYNQVMHWVARMDTQDWLLTLVGALVVGFLLLQGFGSRAKY
jgi:hypothetical protein